MTNNFTRQLRDVLSEDNFEAVFSILKTFLQSEPFDSDFINDLSMIKGNYVSAEKRFYNNEISREHHTLETAKVRRAVTMILEEIDTMPFDETKAVAIVQDTLRAKSTILPVKSVKNSLKYAFYISLILLSILIISYFTFREVPKNQSMEAEKVRVEKKQIKPSDFDFYSKEAARIRQTVGQDNYTTEDGKMRIRKSKFFLDTALMALPDDGMSYNSRADCYMILGKLDSAMADVETSLSYDSYNTYTYATRAQIKALKGDVEGFYKDINEALMRGHDVWKMRNSLGVRDYRDEKRFIRLLKQYKQYKE